MANPKTWILTKSTSYPPDDFRLQLGQILTDPRLPMLPLFPSSEEPPPKMVGMQVAENVTKGVVIGTNSNVSPCFGLWANTAVVPADGQLTLAQEKGTWWEWRLDELVDKATSFNAKHIRSLVQDNDTIKDYIYAERVGSLGKKLFPSLYIVTGLRIAKGAKMEMASTETVQGQLSFRVNLNPNDIPAANLGLLAQATKLRQDHASFSEASDFIFAYQCTEIQYFLVPRQKVYRGGDTQTAGGPPPKRQKADDGKAEQEEGEEEDQFDVLEGDYLRAEEFGALEDDVEETDILRDTDETKSLSERVNVLLSKEPEEDDTEDDGST